MSVEAKGSHSYILQVAVFSFTVALAFVMCVVLFFPLMPDVRWYAANAALAVITIYIFERVVAYSALPPHLKRTDKGFIVHPLLAIGVVVIPAILNFLYRTQSFLPDEKYRNISVLATLACLAVLASCLILIVASAPTSDTGTVSEHITLPVTVLSLVVFLGSDEALAYLTHVIPPEVADLNLTLRNVVAATVGLVIFFDFVRLWLGRGNEFASLIKDTQNSVPRRRNGQEISLKNGPLGAVDTFLLTLHSVFKYPILVVVIIGKFLIILIESAIRSFVGLLFTRRFAIGLLFSVLILTTIVVENGSEIIMTNLADTVTSNSTNDVAGLNAITYLAWMVLIVFSYARLCHGRFDGLFPSWLLVVSLSICGLWLASLVLHVAATMGWLDAPGFAFSWSNPFFWFVAALGLIGLAVGGRQVWGGEVAAPGSASAVKPAPPPSATRGEWYFPTPSKEGLDHAFGSSPRPKRG